MTEGRWWHVFDERRTRGGRVKSWLFLTHPGPSLLVTAVTVAATGVLERRVPEWATTTSLVLVMLPAQFAIGALNDWADAQGDGVHQPFKPLPRGAVSRRVAVAVAVGGLILSLGTAAHWSSRFLLIDVLGAGAGVAYDLGLKRTPLSFICWWGGFEAVVMLATAAANTAGALVTLPLSGLLALGLLVSNALPDAAGDRLSATTTPAVLLGARSSRRVVVFMVAVAAVYAGAVAVPLRLGAGALVTALTLGGATCLFAALPLRTVSRAGFALLSLLTAIAAVSWLAALPGSAVV